MGKDVAAQRRMSELFVGLRRGVIISSSYYMTLLDFRNKIRLSLKSGAEEEV